MLLLAESNKEAQDILIMSEKTLEEIQILQDDFGKYPPFDEIMQKFKGQYCSLESWLEHYPNTISFNENGTLNIPDLPLPN